MCVFLAWQEARTRIVVAECGYLGGEPVTRVLLFPHTGRRHQLRVHLAALGHPICACGSSARKSLSSSSFFAVNLGSADGDFTYEAARGDCRMLLHARALVLPFHLVGRKRKRMLQRAARKQRERLHGAAAAGDGGGSASAGEAGSDSAGRMKRGREGLLPRELWGGLSEEEVPFPVREVRVVAPDGFELDRLERFFAQHRVDAERDGEGE